MSCPRLAFTVIFFVCAIVALSPSPLFADTVGYSGKETLTLDQGALAVRHTYDWGKWDALNTLDKEPDHAAAMFTEANKCARITVTDTASQTLLLDTPCPAFTRLWLSPDNRFLVGLSHIMISNPVQLAVWEIAASPAASPENRSRLIWRECIQPYAHALPAEALASLREKFPETWRIIAPGIRPWGDLVVLPVKRYYNFPKAEWDQVWAFLRPWHNRHPYSPNFSSTVTNFVYWYSQDDPAPRIETLSPDLIELSLLDSGNVRFRIHIPLTASGATNPPGPTAETPFPRQRLRQEDLPEVQLPTGHGFFVSRVRTLALNSPRLLRHFARLPATGASASDVRTQLADTLRTTQASPDSSDAAAARDRNDITDIFELTPLEADGARTLAINAFSVLPGLKFEQLKKLRCQMIGLRWQDRRLALLNFIPAPGPGDPPGWQTQLQTEDPPLQMLYDPARHAIIHLRMPDIEN
ncbi:hypothetical protein OpiT1DRAFT_03022 [Opitutaceae bacterium TAV1]|nr:hypothetical protein OpiT1DRAFT_03022 [Opitutaceae bacterium TAV1]